MPQTKATVAAQGNAGAASASTDGNTVVAGWLLNANGTPYTGAATLQPTDSQVSCSATSAVSLRVMAASKVVAPSVGSFRVDRSSNLPVIGTRFYLSAAPTTAAVAVKR